MNTIFVNIDIPLIDGIEKYGNQEKCKKNLEVLCSCGSRVIAAALFTGLTMFAWMNLTETAEIIRRCITVLDGT